MRHKLATLCILLAALFSHGQTWQQQYPKQPLRFNDITFIDSLNGWLIADRGIIWHSDDGGRSWEIQQSGVNSSLNRVFFADRQAGWIVGEDGTILATKNGGQSWQKVTSPVQARFIDIFFLNRDVGWILGGASLLKTTDGGTTWTILATPWLNKLIFLNDSIGWGTNGQSGTYKTTDGGLSWSPKPTPMIVDPETGYSITDFIVISPDTVLFVESVSSHTISWEQVLKTTDGGNSWSETRLYSANKITVLNDTVLVLGSSVIYTSGDLSTWRQRSGNFPPFIGTSFVDSKHWWTTGWDGSLYKTTDGGHTWQRLIPGAKHTLYAVRFYDYLHGWASGSEDFILGTTDGGETWTVQHEDDTLLNSAIYALDFVSTTKGWGVASTQDFSILNELRFKNTLYSTVGGGKVWSKREFTSPARFLSLEFIDEQNGWLGGWYGSILHTSDGGATWHLQYQEDTTYEKTHGNPQIESIFFLDRNRGWAAGNKGRFMKTTDGGENWRVQYVDTTLDLRKIGFLDDKNGWMLALGDSSYMLKTSDGGSSWKRYKLPARSYYLTDVQFTSLSHGWLKDVNNIYSTKDGGISWNYLSTIPDVLGYGATWRMNFTDEKTGWFVTEKETILRFDANITPVGDDAPFEGKPYNFNLYQNYPNPFNPSTIIRYESPSRTHVTLKVYNLLGQEVVTLVDEVQDAGFRSVEFEGSHLSSGVYFYRLQAGKFVQTKKLILLR